VHPLAVSERRFVPQSLAIALNPCSYFDLKKVVGW